MLLSPIDAAVVGSMFHGHAEEFHRAGFQPEWLETSLGQKVASAQISLGRQKKPVNALNVLSLIGSLSPDEATPIVNIAKNGYGDVVVEDALRAARDNYLARRSRELGQELMRATPATARTLIQSTNESLSNIHRAQQNYSPLPSQIYQNQIPEVTFRFTTPEFNEITRGGARPMLMILNGISGHGKSTSIYSLICDAVAQHQMAVLINNENTVRKALDRILRGVSKLTAEEVAHRQGSTPQRHEILMAWVKHLDIYLRIYDADHYSPSGIRDILSWDQPKIMGVDYLRESPGISQRGSKDPVGDMAYFLLTDVANHPRYACMVLTGGQMSAEHAKKFKKSGLHVVDIMYGTARPYHAADIFTGLRRHPTLENTGSFHTWKDRIANRINDHEDIPFDDKLWLFTSKTVPMS